MKKQRLVKRIVSLTTEQDKWIKQQGKQKPFTTGSQYVRSVLQADYDNHKAKFSRNSSAAKRS